MSNSLLEDRKIVHLKRGLIDLGDLVDNLQRAISEKDIKAVSRTIDNIRGQNYYIKSVLNPSLDYEIFNFDQIKQLIDDNDIKYLLSKSKLGQELIVAWFKIFDSVPERDFFSNDEMVQIYIDRKLPTAWNFSRDIAIISSEHVQAIMNDLIRRGQSRIALTGDACKMEFSEDYSDKQIVKINETTDFIDFLIGLGLHDYAQAICLIDPIGSSQNLAVDLVQQGQDFLNDLAINIRTSELYRKDWINQKLINFVENKRSIDHSVLPLVFKDKDVLVVSPGPSLKNDLEVLKQCQKDFLIIAVAQSLPGLTSENIIPDFVMVIDSNDFSHVLSDLVVENAMGIIAVEQVHRNFLAPNFKTRIILYDINDVTPTRNWRDIRAYNHDGGSVSVSAFKLALRSGARSVALLGQDLVLSSGQYFLGNEDFSKKEKTENQLFFPSNATPKIEEGGKFFSLDGERKAALYLLGIDGKQHLTKGDYFYFHRQFVYSAIDHMRQASPTPIINCTSSGAYIDGFDHLPLAEHHKNICKDRDSSPQNRQEEIDFLLALSFKNDDAEITNWFEELKYQIEILQKSGHDLKALISHLDINDSRWSSYFSTLQEVGKQFPIVDAIASNTTNAVSKRISITKKTDALVKELNWFLEEMDEHCQYLISQIDRIAIDKIF